MILGEALKQKEIWKLDRLSVGQSIKRNTLLIAYKNINITFKTTHLKIFSIKRKSMHDHTKCSGENYYIDITSCNALQKFLISDGSQVFNKKLRV